MIVIAAILVPVAAVLPSDRVALDALATEVESMQDARDGVTTAFEFVHYAPMTMEEIGGWPEGARLSETFDFQWIQVRDRVSGRIARRGAEAPGNEEVVNSFWDGLSWYEGVSHPQGRSWRIAPEWPRTLEFDCLSLFNAIEGPSILGGRSLDDALRCYEVISLVEDGDHVRVDLALDPARTNRATLSFHRAPLMLESFDFRIYGSANELRTRVHYHVVDWEIDGDHMIPSLAYRDGYGPTERAESAEPWCAVVHLLIARGRNL